MAITNGYVTLDELKTYVNISDTADDAQLELAVEAASRDIDLYCGRFFYDSGSATAKTFRAEHAYELDVPDFSTTSGLVVKTDTTDNGTYDTTWLSTDYQVEPLNPEQGYPWTSLTAIDTKTFPTGGRRATVEVTAQWGWAAVPKQVKHACAVHASVLHKRATEGAAPIVTMGGVTLPSGRFMDGQVTMLVQKFQRLTIGAV